LKDSYIYPTLDKNFTVNKKGEPIFLIITGIIFEIFVKLMLILLPDSIESNTRKGFFEHGDFLALRDVLPEYLKGFITFVYKFGWRKSEIADLTWSQVDLDQRIVSLEPGITKDDDGRIIYLDAELKEFLDEHMDTEKTSSKAFALCFP